MKVLLISENQCRDNMIPYPLGTAWIAAAARSAGHEVAGLDLMFSDDIARDTARAVADFSPDCIGISIRNIDNQDIKATEFYLPPVRAVVSACRSGSGAPIVLGGAGFTIFPLECLEYLDVELGIVGEGEESFPRLLEVIESGGDPRDLPGLALRRDGTSRVNPLGALPDIERLIMPDHAAFDVGLYNFNPGAGQPFMANVQSRRGCHMQCIYCSSPLIEGRAVRMRDPVLVADEAQALDELGIKTVMFTDSLFNYPRDYARRLCRELASRKLNLTWGASYSPAFNDPELFDLMREAGCYTLSIGNESGSEDMLASLRKGFGKEQILESVRSTREAGLSYFCFLMLGGPGETRESVEESICFVEELEPESVRVTVGIRIYAGCELVSIAEREGLIEPGRNLLHPVFYLAPEVEPWLLEYMEEACRQRPGWIL
ncbi:MAG TPA: radical SAM protein [Candidatus Anoxymicrobiaceae bacterium]